MSGHSRALETTGTEITDKHKNMDSSKSFQRYIYRKSLMLVGVEGSGKKEQ
jgi:hypothetical protein